MISENGYYRNRWKNAEKSRKLEAIFQSKIFGFFYDDFHLVPAEQHRKLVRIHPKKAQTFWWKYCFLVPAISRVFLPAFTHASWAWQMDESWNFMAGVTVDDRYASPIIYSLSLCIVTSSPSTDLLYLSLFYHVWPFRLIYKAYSIKGKGQLWECRWHNTPSCRKT